MTKAIPIVKESAVTFVYLLFAFLIFGLFLSINGTNPLLIYENMFGSTISDSYGLGQVIVKTSPLLMIAVATCISAKAGLVNVGGEGQFVLGAMFSTMAAVFLVPNASGFIGKIVMAAFGMLGGAIWSGIAGVMKVKAGMNETLTTVIMNYIAFDIVAYFVYGTLKDPESFNWPQSPKISRQLELLEIAPGVSVAIIVALLTAVITWYVIKKSAKGFTLRVIGGNTAAAKHAGIDVDRIQIQAMLISGALSGFAGMLEIAGVEGRLRTTTGTNYGYFGFLAAWMAWNNPLLAILTAFVIGFLSVAGGVLEISSGLPSSCTKILMAIILLAILWKGKSK